MWRLKQWDRRSVPDRASRTGKFQCAVSSAFNESAQQRCWRAQAERDTECQDEQRERFFSGQHGSVRRAIGQRGIDPDLACTGQRNDIGRVHAYVLFLLQHAHPLQPLRK